MLIKISPRKLGTADNAVSFLPMKVLTALQASVLI